MVEKIGWIAEAAPRGEEDEPDATGSSAIRATPPGSSLFAAGGPLSAEALAAVRAHPGFPEALRGCARSFVDLYQGNRLLNTLLNDRGRLLMTGLALYLHYSRRLGDPHSGLTVSRMKALCAEHGVCSAGRAEIMLGMMRVSGYLAPAENEADRRLRLLTPTERLVNSFAERMRRQFKAAAHVLPQCGLALEAVHRPDFIASLARHQGDFFVSGVRVLEHAPELGLFVERNAGLLILFSLLLAGSADDTMPPARPVSFSISGLSRRFGVSRAHTRALLRDAEQEGFLQRAAGDESRILVLPKLADAVQNFLAAVFLFFAHCASLALAETKRERAA